MSTSAKNMTVFCDDCKHEFSVNSVNIATAPVTLNGKSYDLSYFACPKCRRIYRIALMDQRYYELQADIERTKKRIRRNHGSRNVEFAGTLNTMVRAKLERLRNHTDTTNRKFPGVFVFATSDNGEENKTIKYLP